MNQQHIQEKRNAGGAPIAVISIGCRFAGGVTSATKLRKLCATGCVMISEIFEVNSTAGPWTPDKISHTVRVLGDNFGHAADAASLEWEYVVKDNLLHVTRIYPDKETDRSTRRQESHGADLIESLLSDLHFTDYLAVLGDVPEGMVEIEPKAFGINFHDVLSALGRIDETLMGHDCSGIVTRLGPGTEQSGLRAGDQICALAEGRFASIEHARWTSVAKIRDGMSWKEAATLPVYITAHYAMFEQARLKRGETILIHSATGSFGQASLMLAQHLGGDVFVTCSSPAKRRLLEERYRVPADHILYSRDTSFADRIMELTGGRGVDCVARFGRFIELGKVEIAASWHLDMATFSRCASLFAVDGLQVCAYDPMACHSAITGAVRLVEEPATTGVRPVFSRTIFPMSDMESAMRQMQGATHMGRVILSPRTGDQVKVVARPRPLDLRREESIYLITGGLGGLGRAIALWMVGKEAKNIVLVSRNVEAHPEAASLAQKASEGGCRLHIRKCDVADEESVVELLAECSASLPSIRGVAMGSMVLDDSVFEHMTYDQWLRATRPKVAGTLNFLRHSGSQLSFFVMLSSFGGVIGHLSQANYSAGNAFQDALTRHRTGVLGLPAVSVDLPAVMGAGFVFGSGAAERERILKGLGADRLPLERLHKLLEAVISDSPRKKADKSQVIVCLVRYGVIEEGPVSKRDRRFATVRFGGAKS
ncbi:type I polyketide synthase, partial [Colletotrichum musicola]